MFSNYSGCTVYHLILEKPNRWILSSLAGWLFIYIDAVVLIFLIIFFSLFLIFLANDIIHILTEWVICTCARPSW